MITLKINNKELNVSKDLTILQAAALVDIQIPRFCFHEKLSIAGNCRMCLVEVAKVNKPVASCALPVAENMQVFTNSILVKKAREGVLELLLANHPLDCPICDQGGECDLQDQAMIFGNDRSRFYEIKRAVSDKTISPLIKTIMTRCIHCTRCVRFLTEIVGVNQLGVTGRGSASEIGTYIDTSIFSELSGNIIDLCPVGALTSKPYAFTARPWELRTVETLDVNDALGSNIRIDIRGPDIMRILPKVNYNLNEEWITDKTRFSFDGLKIQRLNAPTYIHKTNYIYNFKSYQIGEKVNNYLLCSWEVSFEIIREIFFLAKKNTFINDSFFVLGNSINIEVISIIREFVLNFGFSGIFNKFTSFTNNSFNSYDFPSQYSFNITPDMLINIDVCLLVGTNLRLENPLLNIRLRKAFLSNNTIIGSIGPTTNAIYNLIKLGNSLNILKLILEGKHHFSILLLNSKKPLILVGNSLKLLNINISSLLYKINKKIVISFVNSFIGEYSINNIIGNDNFLFTELNKRKKRNIYYLIDNDELDLKKDLNDFYIYQGFIGDRSTLFSDLILPSLSYVEEEGSFFDITGKLNETNIAIPGPIGARTSWKILLALIHYFQLKNNLPLLNMLDLVDNAEDISLQKINICNLNFKKSILLPNIILNNIISNFYMTSNITRNSKIMAKASKNYNIKFNMNLMHS